MTLAFLVVISSANAARERYQTRICAIGGLYPREHEMFGKTVTATIRADALPSEDEKIVVTPFDSFGNRGRSLASSL